MFRDIFLLFIFALLWEQRAGFVDAQAIGCIYTGGGPAIVSQDPNTGDFLYNIYSQKGYGPMQSVKTVATPKNGTAIGLAGWNAGLSVYIAIFFQTNTSSLSSLLVKFAYASGICINYGEAPISRNVSTPVHPNTSIVAELFATAIGYHVTYQDIHGQLRQVRYANNSGDVTTWGYDYPIGNFSAQGGSALSAIYTQGSNITAESETIFQVSDSQIRPLVATVYNKTNSIHDLETWSSGATVNTASLMPHFNATSGPFATISYPSWLCLFYIDTRRQLQLLRSTDNGQTWQPQPPQDTTSWPLADYPTAPIAAATSLNATGVTAANTGGTDPKVLKIGIALGVSVFFLLVLAIIGYLVHRRRRQIPESSIEKPGSRSSTSSRDFHNFGKPELDGEGNTLSELDHDPECRLLHQLALMRQYELRAGIPTELQNSEIERPKLEMDGLCGCEIRGRERFETGEGEIWEAGGVERFELPAFLERWSRASSRVTGRRGRSRARSFSEVSVVSAKVEGMGKENKVVVEIKEIPGWAWDNLRREEDGVEKKQKVEDEVKKEKDEGVMNAV